MARAYANYLAHTLDLLRAQGQQLAALILEPLVIGAGGMLFIDPLFQRVLVDVVRKQNTDLMLELLVIGAGGMPFVDPLFQRILMDVVRKQNTRPSRNAWSGVPVIFDEVLITLVSKAVVHSGIDPDIAVYAKALTGGLVPLAVTLALNSIFEAFLTNKKADALLHGHSYTAHAIGCEVANKTLALVEKVSLWMIHSPDWSLWDPEFVNAISNLPQVREVMTSVG